MAGVVITEFTDPACPWAWSAEPNRRRLDWIYGDEVQWRTRMVVLAKSPEEYEEKGFTPEKQAESYKRISAEHGMPISTEQRPRMSATVDACRAVVAARLNAPERERQVLRCLRVANFSGKLLDDPETIANAAETAGLDPGNVREWCERDETEQALREDMTRAREPMPAAKALDHKLANWSGGRRYTCPSYEICRTQDGVTISVPGFQPFAAYDVVLANLIPDLDRREPPDDAAEVLRWAGTPLATQEVATVMDIERAEARERLGAAADERHVGADGFWTLPE
ncbi:hypothetical protein BH24ACT23_BH24ACT23_06090 [soil metagenome]